MEPLYQQKNGNKGFNLLEEENLKALQTGMEKEKDGEFTVEAEGVSYIAVKKTMEDTGWTFLNLVPLRGDGRAYRCEFHYHGCSWDFPFCNASGIE